MLCSKCTLDNTKSYWEVTFEDFNNHCNPEGHDAIAGAENGSFCQQSALQQPPWGPQQVVVQNAFGSCVADGSSLCSALRCSCGYCSAFISQRWTGKKAPAHQFHILHPFTASHGQVHAQLASIQRMHRDTVLGRSRRIFLSPFHSCNFTAHVPILSLPSRRTECVLAPAWAWDTVGWCLCACSSRTQETLV